MKYLLQLVFFILLSQAIGQNYYSKKIDIEKRPQAASQICQYLENKLIVFVENCDETKEICSGILLVNNEGEILKRTVIPNFSANFNSLLIDTIHQRLLLAGEEDVPFRYATSFLIYEIDINNFESKSKHYIDQPLNPFIKLYQTGFAYFNNKIIITGVGRKEINSPNQSLMFVLNYDLSVDTLITIKFGKGNCNIVSTYVDHNNLLTSHINFEENEFGNKAKALILKFGSDFKFIEYWISQQIDFKQLAVGCPIKSNGTAVAMPDRLYNNTLGSVWLLRDDIVNFIFEWNNKSGQFRSIHKLIETNESGIVGVGSYRDIQNHINGTFPFIFKIDLFGNLLWEKYFYLNNMDSLSSSGYLDYVILDNDNSFWAVGRLDNRINKGIETNIADPDILLVHLDANGCILNDCSDGFLVEDTPTIIDELSTPEEFKYYPNPTSDKIHFSGFEKITKIELYSLDGKRLLVNEIIGGDGLDVSMINKGVYVLSCYFMDGKVEKRKVVVQR